MLGKKTLSITSVLVIYYIERLVTLNKKVTDK